MTTPDELLRTRIRAVLHDMLLGRQGLVILEWQEHSLTLTTEVGGHIYEQEWSYLNAADILDMSHAQLAAILRPFFEAVDE